MNRIQLVAIGTLAATVLGLGGGAGEVLAQTARKAPAERQTQPLRSAAKRRLPVPPNKGTYRTSRGGGNRSKSVPPACSFPMGRLVPEQFISMNGSDIDTESEILKNKALKSATTGGFTTAARPSFWAYLPSERVELESLKFELQNDRSGEVEYETPISLSATSGIAKIQLPQTAPELEFDKTYRWFLIATVDCEGRSIELDLDGGWIQRYQPDAALAQQLSAAQDYRLYRDKGLWFDALELLGNQRRQQPNAVGLAQEWMELLELYGLGVWAEEQLSDCCEVVEGEAIAPNQSLPAQ